MKDNKEEVRVSEAPATGSANDHMSRREKVLAEKKIAPLVISFIIPIIAPIMLISSSSIYKDIIVRNIKIKSTVTPNILM